MSTTLTKVPYPYTELLARVNRVPNPSVEVDLSGWGAAAGGGTAALSHLGPFPSIAVDEAPQTSAYFVRCTWSVASTSVAGGVYCSITALTPGVTYSASLYVRASQTQRMALSIDWYTAGDAYISTSTVGSAVVVSGSWTRLTLPGVVAPASAAKGSLVAIARVGTSGVVWSAGSFMDAEYALVEQTVEPGPYFDGATPNAGRVGVRYSWSGTAHASISYNTSRTPAAGALQVTAERVTAYQSDRRSSTVLHEVIGRPDPVPALGALRSRTGRFTVWCADEATAHALVDLYEVAGVVMLRDPAHSALEMYHVPTRISPVMEFLTADGTWRWLVDVEFAETYGTASLW